MSMPPDRQANLVWTRSRGKHAKKEPYVAARVIERKPNGEVKIVHEGGGAQTEQVLPAADTMLRNPPGTRPDNCQLLHLNEACVLENVATRFIEGQIYTWTSHVLTAINPYEVLPLYSDRLIDELPKMNTRDLPPHAFSTAELAVRHLVRGSQAIVVSGESGAGKTTNMVYVMSYLTRRMRNAGISESALGDGLGTLLLQSNPVLEAFGNAQTVRNHNSSRFGKFIKVTFDASGTRMNGMYLHTYLLEKVRVVAPGAAERTYHVFYAMLAGASAAERQEWGIRSSQDHQLTSRTAASNTAAAAQGSAETYRALRQAMSVLTVRSEEQIDLLGIVAAILHLRDVRFEPLEDEEGCRPKGSAALAAASRLLGCPGIALRLVQRVVQSGRQEPITVTLSAEQASSARDSLCKALYVAAFKHICTRFNEAAVGVGATVRGEQQPLYGSGGRKRGLSRSPTDAALERASPAGEIGAETPSGRKTGRQSPGVDPRTPGGGPGADGPFIGLLDMFGFESFEINSFEQLCINLANERLQGYFQHCVFVSEEEVHRLEGVPWPSVLEYHDNRGCIHLVEKSILPLLDEACGLQSATEDTFFLRVHEACGRDQFFTAPRRKHLLEEEGFIIRHFAGDVCYCSASAAANSTRLALAFASRLSQGGDGSSTYNNAAGETWLKKNADRLLPELTTELRSSSSPLVSTMFVRRDEEGRGSPSEPVSSNGRRLDTVARRFTSELDVLLKDLGQTKTLFIRCIKPNERAAAKLLDHSAVLAQLRCLGMTDVVRLMHHSYPTRIPYTDLHGRYAAAMPPVLADLPPRDFAEAVALMCEVSLEDMKLGTNRLFLRGGKGMFLEELAEMDIGTAMPLLLAKIEQMNTRRNAGQIVARAIWTYHLRVTHQRKRVAAGTVVRCWRGARARQTARQMIDDRRMQREEEEMKVAKRLQAQQAAAAEQAAKFDAAFAAVPGLGMEPSTATPSESSSTALHIPSERSAGGPRARGGEEEAPAPAPVDAALWSSLGVQPLCTAQLHAIRALRQRLGEHLMENTSEVANKQQQQSSKDGAPARRRLHAAPGGNKPPPPGLPPPSWMRVAPSSEEGQRYDVVLTRDARDGTLGIDLDQFAGQPTVAIVVAGGPAERDGTVRVGDILLAVDGLSCSSIAEVITILTSPQVSAKNTLPVTILRMPTIVVNEDLLLVRARSTASAADGLGGLLGGLREDHDHLNDRLAILEEWTPCVCTLFSDRRLSVAERTFGIDLSFDLRAALSVQLVLVDAGDQAQELSCLQVRVNDGLIEFCSAGMARDERTALERWQQPLEEMLMLSLGTVHRSWLYEVSSQGTHSRVFLDLNHRSQLRTIMEMPRPGNFSTLGVIELAELHEIELVTLTTQVFASQRGAGGTLALQLTDGDNMCFLTSQRQEDMVGWAKDLHESQSHSLVRLVQYTGMILIDGWLEYQGDEDEWAPGFFMLTIGGGLQCFENVVSEPARAMPIETIPLSNITGAVRSKGIDYYDWCVDIRTTDLDYIRVRPPRQAEMTRWLATINLYCSPPPKRKPERPRRRSTHDESTHGSRPSRVGSKPPAAPHEPSDLATAVAPSNLLPTSRPAPPPEPPPHAQQQAPPNPPPRSVYDQMGDGLLPRVSEALGAGDDVILRLAASSESAARNSRAVANPEGSNGEHHEHPASRPGVLVVPSEPQHTGLVRGWSHESSASSGSSAVQQPQPPSKRRSLSFTRRRSAQAPQAAPKPAAPSRGGRLRGPTSRAAAGADLIGAVAPPEISSADTSTTSIINKIAPLRRPSFGRRRRATSTTEAAGAPSSADSDGLQRASTLETPRQSPAKPPAEEHMPGVGVARRAVRALSFGRRRSSNRDSHMPPRAPPVVKTTSDEGNPVRSASTHSDSDRSGLPSAGSEAGAPTTPPKEGAKVARSSSFGNRIVRRAASFSTRRKPNDFSDA